MTTTRKTPKRPSVLVYQDGKGSWVGTLPITFAGGARGYITRTLITRKADNALNLPNMRSEAEAAVPRVFADELAQ